MKLSDYKLGEFTVKISKLPTRITNKAEWLKAQFDARGNELKEVLDRLIDALEAGEGETPGASLIGAVGLDGKAITVEDHILDEDNPHNLAERVKTLVAEELKGAGAGDMVSGIYDPDGRETDIFAYTDNAIKAAIGSALTGEV